MAEFLESGALDVHLNRLRVELWRSVEAARGQVLRLFPAGTRVSRPEGGVVLWIQLPEGYDGIEVQRRAAAAGINAERPVRQLHPHRVRPSRRRDDGRGRDADRPLGSDHAPTPV